MVFVLTCLSAKCLFLRKKGGVRDILKDLIGFLRKTVDPGG